MVEKMRVHYIYIGIGDLGDLGELGVFGRIGKFRRFWRTRKISKTPKTPKTHTSLPEHKKARVSKTIPVLLVSRSCDPPLNGFTEQSTNHPTIFPFQYSNDP